MADTYKIYNSNDELAPRTDKVTYNEILDRNRIKNLETNKLDINGDSVYNDFTLTSKTQGGDSAGLVLESKSSPVQSVLSAYEGSENVELVINCDTAYFKYYTGAAYQTTYIPFDGSSSTLATRDYVSDSISTLESNIKSYAAFSVDASINTTSHVLNISLKNFNDSQISSASVDLDNIADTTVTQNSTKFITSGAVYSAISTAVSSAVHYKGTVSTYANLPTTGLTIGDLYNVETADSAHGIKAGDNVIWNGTAWDVQSGTIDLSNYYTKTQTDSAISTATSGMATQTWVTTQLGSYSTTTAMNSAITSAITTNNSNYYNKTTSDGRFAPKTYAWSTYPTIS